jgi:uncharacterized membrane protein
MGFVVGAVDDDGYKIVLILHILCAIVGVGAVFLSGLYAAQARSRRGAESLAIAEANFRVSRIGEYFIYAVFVLGIGLVSMSDSVYDFGQTWVWLATALLVVVIGLSHGALVPREKKMIGLMQEMVAGGARSPAAAEPAGPPPQAAELEVLGRQVAVFGGTVDVLLVVIVFLMVWKPGF